MKFLATALPAALPVALSVFLCASFLLTDPASAGRLRKRKVAGVIDGFSGKSMTLIQERGIRFRTIKRKDHLKFKMEEGSVVEVMVRPKKVKMLKPYNRKDAYRRRLLRKLKAYRKKQEEKNAYSFK